MVDIVLQQIIDYVLSHKKHVDIIFSLHTLRHLDLSQLRTYLVEPFGEPALHYSVPLTNGGRLHIRQFSDHFKIHWDAVDPLRDLIGHLKEDAPHWIKIISIVLLGVSIYAVAKQK